MRGRIPEAGVAATSVTSGKFQEKVVLGDESGACRGQLPFPHKEMQPFAHLRGSG